MLFFLNLIKPLISAFKGVKALKNYASAIVDVLGRKGAKEFLGEAINIPAKIGSAPLKAGKQLAGPALKISPINAQIAKLKYIVDPKARAQQLINLVQRELGYSDLRKVVVDIVDSPKEIGTRLGKMTQDERRDVGNELAQSDQQISGAVPDAYNFYATRQSTWIASAVFRPAPQNTSIGELTIKTYRQVQGRGKKGTVVLFSGKSYTYANVLRNTWDQMKRAPNFGEARAGTIFWALHLRSYRMFRVNTNDFLNKVLAQGMAPPS